MKTGSDTRDIPQGAFDLLAPNEKIIWAGNAHPSFPYIVLMADLAYVCVAVAAWLGLGNEVIPLALFFALPLVFFNVVSFARYNMSHGRFYICSDRRYLIVRRKWTGTVEFISVPRHVVEYISLQKRGLVLYNDIGYHRKVGEHEIPRGFLELDNAQETLQCIESADGIDIAPEAEPAAVRLGDLPLPVEQREILERLLAPDEKLYYASRPSHGFGVMQLLGLAGVGLICRGALTVLEHLLGKGAFDDGDLVVCLVCIPFAGVLLLIAACPLLSLWHRRTSLFFLTDRRAGELNLKSGGLQQEWEATPELIKKATLRRNGCGSFLFTLDHAKTSRADATNSESGVDCLPDARRLIGIINSLPRK